MLNKRTALIFVLLLVAFLLAVAAFFILNNPNLVNNSGKTSAKKIVMITASDLQLTGVDGIEFGLKEFGYKENEDIIYEVKNPRGDQNLAKKFAAEAVAEKPDLIVSLSTSASKTVSDANVSAKIPIVAVDVGNFNDLGINNIQHPGGFMTGVVVDNVASAPKRLEILHTLVPNAKTIAVLVDPNHLSFKEISRVYESGAKKLGLTIMWRNVTKKEELAGAMDKIIKERPGAFITAPQPLISENSDIITKNLKEAKIASIDQSIERGVKAGYLMVYGVSRFSTGKQAARIIDKVLKGEKPADIPIEFISDLSFEINGALAKEFGIIIPKQLLLQANKIYNE